MKNIIMFFLLFVGLNAFSQYTLKGKTLTINNEPVSNVQIYLSQLNKGTVSDFNGDFNFDEIPLQNVVITVSSIGFKAINKSIDLKKNNEITFQLEESSLELDEVIVSTPFGKLQRNNVMKVESINLENSNYNSAVNLTDKLTEITGVSTISTGNGIGKPTIRGLNGSRVLTYNQGIRLENFQFGEKHGLGVNENGIASVEIIKGPASLLYGSDALGGVIYLVPEKYEYTNKTSYSLNSKFHSNSLGFNNSFGVKSTSDKLKVLARLSYNMQSDYKTGSDIRVTNSRFNDKDFKMGLGFDDKKIFTDIRYNFNQSENGITHDIDEQTTSKKMEGTYQKLNNHYLSVKNKFFLKDFTIKSTIGFTSHNRNLMKDNVKVTDMDLNTLNYHINFHLLNQSKLKTVIGVQGMFQNNENNAANAFLPDASILDFGIFGTTNYDFNAKNTLQFGLRFDYRNMKTSTFTKLDNTLSFNDLSKDYTNFSGSVGFKSKLLKTIDYRLNMAFGYRAPNLSELFSDGLHEGKYEIGNQDLDTESNLQADVTLEYENKNFEFFVNGFYNQIVNYIYLKPTGDTIDNLQVFQYQQDDSKLFGGELGLHYHPSNLKWVHLKSSGEFVRGQVIDGDNLPRMPSFTIKNRLNLDFKLKNLEDNYFSIGNKNVFKQNEITSDETVGEAYQIFDIGLGSNFELSKIDTHFSITVSNLFDKKYINHLSVLKEEDIENAGRNVILNFKFKF